MAERTALLFAYDGAVFDGYARQPDEALRTVEGALVGRLVGAGVFGAAGPGRFRSGSRTDRGVSALANVVAFDSDIPAGRVAQAVGLKEEGLWPIASMAVDGSFDPRRALRREYRYFIGGTELPGGAGPGDLQAALGPFLGRHDFSGFARLEAGRDPVRSVEEASARVDGGVVEVRIVGPSFLWNQVRRMVGAALAVLRGEASRGDLARWLEVPGEARDLGLAPAERLVLWSVEYAGLRFRAEPPVRERLGGLLEGRALDLDVRARAAREVGRRLAPGG